MFYQIPIFFFFTFSGTFSVFNVISTFLFHLNASLLIFISFWLIWAVLEGFGEIRNPRWPTARNHDVISASCDVINSWRGSQRKQLQFQKYYTLSKFYCCSFYILGGSRAPHPPPPGPEGQKKPGLGRVKKIWLPISCGQIPQPPIPVWIGLKCNYFSCLWIEIRDIILKYRIYSIKRPASKERPSLIGAHPEGRKS